MASNENSPSTLNILQVLLWICFSISMIFCCTREPQIGHHTLEAISQVLNPTLLNSLNLLSTFLVIQPSKQLGSLLQGGPAGWLSARNYLQTCWSVSCLITEVIIEDIKSSVRPSIHPWGALHVTSHLQILYYWSQPLETRSPVTSPFTSLWHACKGYYGILVRITVNNSLWFRLIHPISHLIRKSNPDGQAQFVLSKTCWQFPVSCLSIIYLDTHYRQNAVLELANVSWERHGEVLLRHPGYFLLR